MKILVRCAGILLLTSSALQAQEVYLEQHQTVSIVPSAIVRLEFNAAANLLAIAAADRSVRLVNAATLEAPVQLPPQQVRITALAFTRSGQTLITGSADGNVISWRIAGLAPGIPFSPHRGGIAALAVQEENLVFTVGADKSIRITDLNSGNSVGSVSVSPLEPTAIALQPDGKIFAVATSAGTVQFTSLPGLTPGLLLKDNASRITVAAFSPDSKHFVAGTFDGQLIIWNAATGALESKIQAYRGAVTSLAFEQAATWLASTGTDSSLALLDVPAMKIVQTMTGTPWTQAAFATNGMLLAATSTGSVLRWTVRKEPPDIDPPTVVIKEPTPLAVNVPRRMFATEITVRGIVWDNKSLKEVTVGGTPVQLVNAAPSDAIGLPEGALVRGFSIKLRLDTVGVNRFAFTATDAKGLSGAAVLAIERLSANDALEVLGPQITTEVEGVSTALSFRPWFDVSTYSVTINLVEIVRGQRPKNKIAGDVITEEIPLVVGYNQIQLVVNGKNGERIAKTIGVSRKYTPTVTQAPVQQQKKRAATTGPQRWAVVIGVSQYGDPGIPSLKYADKDAEAFANFLRTTEGGGYDNDHMRVLLNKDATLQNVRDGLINFLSQAIDIDLVIIYFAGHGAPEPARPQNLYLLTYDSDPSRLGTTGFPMWQIEDVLGRYITAKKIVVFSDACHSGGISANFATRGVGVTEQNLVNQYLADLSRTKDGTVVFTASAAGEVSQEFPEFGHGVFTQFLLEGLRGKADYNNDFTITINEAMQYTEEQVKRKTRGAQNPTRSQTTYDKDLTVALIPH